MRPQRWDRYGDPVPVATNQNKSEWPTVSPEPSHVHSSEWKSQRTEDVVYVEVEYDTKDFQRDAIDGYAEVVCPTQTSDDLVS